MSCRPTRLAAVFLAATLTLASTIAYAQNGSTTAPLVGTVVDMAGRWASRIVVVVRDNPTGAEFRAVTDDTGRFVIPALNPSTYTVTIALDGFKTLVLPDVMVVAATPASLKAVIEPGDPAERVVVEGACDMLQTQTAAVQQTMVVDQIARYPLRTHNALDLVPMLSATLTTGSGSSGTIINGLPNVTMNITLDGVNVQDNHFRNGSGFVGADPADAGVDRADRGPERVAGRRAARDRGPCRSRWSPAPGRTGSRGPSTTAGATRPARTTRTC